MLFFALTGRSVGVQCDERASLARTGNPNHKGLPNWPAYTRDKRAVIILDAPCRVENDPTSEVRQLMEKRGGNVGGSLPAPGE